MPHNMEQLTSQWTAQDNVSSTSPQTKDIDFVCLSMYLKYPYLLIMEKDKDNKNKAYML